MRTKEKLSAVERNENSCDRVFFCTMVGVSGSRQFFMADESFSHAIRAYEAGRYKEAELLSSEILRDEPDNFRALNMLGMCLHERGESDEGAAYVTQALACNSQYLAAYNNLAAIYKET